MRYESHHIPSLCPAYYHLYTTPIQRHRNALLNSDLSKTHANPLSSFHLQNHSHLPFSKLCKLTNSLYLPLNTINSLCVPLSTTTPLSIT